MSTFEHKNSLTTNRSSNQNKSINQNKTKHLVFRENQNDLSARPLVYVQTSEEVSLWKFEMSMSESVNSIF